MGTERERQALLTWKKDLTIQSYRRWEQKVINMTDTQVIAIYLRLKRTNQI